MLWNTTPNDVCGGRPKTANPTDSGLRKQVERMMASPRLDVGVRAFFEIPAVRSVRHLEKTA